MDKLSSRTLTRRELCQVGEGLIAAAAGTGLLAVGTRALMRPISWQLSPDGVRPAGKSGELADMHLMSTNGWAYFPPTVLNPPWYLESGAPSPFTTSIFGLCDVTGLEPQNAQATGKVQTPAPIIIANEGVDLKIRLTNRGCTTHSGRIDSHTVHWHGVQNQAPYFDSPAMAPTSVPAGRSLNCLYRPRAAGTYLYHLHFEGADEESMSTTGVLLVRPRQNQGSGPIPPGRYVYNDGVQPQAVASTAYDREFVLLLSEIWAQQSWKERGLAGSRSAYRPDFWLMNGRVYPDTLAPNSPGVDPVTGEPVPPAGRPELRYQPMSSLIQANSGERVLVRVVNLGFLLASITLSGLKLRVVGKDGTFLNGRGGAGLEFSAGTIAIAPGESIDAIFTAPDVTRPARYLLYNRNFGHLNHGGATGYGGQMTEVRILPAGTLPPQTRPNS